MKKYNYNENTRIKNIKCSIIDKIVFILTGLSTLVLFLIDLFTNILSLNLKWQIILGLVTVLAGFFTIISFCFDKKFKNLENRIISSEKLMFDSQKTNMLDIDNRLSYLHDLYSYQAYENVDFKEYAQKQIERLITNLNNLCSRGESNVLDERDYYEKLNQLADKIENDQSKYEKFKEQNKQMEKPIIWALTCFNEDEWSEEVQNEDEWSDRLEKIIDNGVGVERICILSDTIKEFIKTEDKDKIISQLNNNKHLKSFICFLMRYYNKKVISKYKKSTKHYAFLESDSVLSETKGFFGICLSNGEKHIVKGEYNVEHQTSTAKIIFFCDNLYSDFEEMKGHRQMLDSYLKQHCSAEFKEFLKSRNVIF